MPSSIKGFRIDKFKFFKDNQEVVENYQKGLELQDSYEEGKWLRKSKRQPKQMIFLTKKKRILGRVKSERKLCRQRPKAMNI